MRPGPGLAGTDASKTGPSRTSYAYDKPLRATTHHNEPQLRQASRRQQKVRRENKQVCYRRLRSLFRSIVEGVRVL